MNLLNQIKQQRTSEKLTQKQAADRINMSRQQWQRLEAGGNPRLQTLEMVAAALGCHLQLIPLEQVDRVNALLNGELEVTWTQAQDNPWAGLIVGDDEE